ncbi:MAG: hypothetical protein KGJ21_10750 [Pseudomonadota bacterium]|nr:hypothetical protein [Pseudomonadota bacterium]
MKSTRHAGRSRRINQRLGDHAGFMIVFQAQGMTREKASEQAARMVKIGARPPGSEGYRVVYGESRPAWEQIFCTLRQAKAFAKEHKSFGDIIFSIKKTVPGEAPQSMMAAIAAAA